MRLRSTRLLPFLGLALSLNALAFMASPNYYPMSNMSFPMMGYPPMSMPSMGMSPMMGMPSMGMGMSPMMGMPSMGMDPMMGGMFPSFSPMSGLGLDPTLSMMSPVLNTLDPTFYPGMASMPSTGQMGLLPMGAVGNQMYPGQFPSMGGGMMPGMGRQFPRTFGNPAW